MMRDEAIPTVEELRHEVISTLRAVYLPEEIKQRINVAFVNALARLHATRPRPFDAVATAAANVPPALARQGE